MKRLLSILLLLVLTVHSKAQTWDEWFKQNKTQRKYLLQQIAQLQLYLGYIKKGYNILNTGLSTIGSIKKGDFQLHELFINDKRRVKSVIKNSHAALEIIKVYNQIRQYWSAFEKIDLTTAFTTEESNYILDYKFNLLQSLSMDVSDLIDILTNGKLKMSDHERIERISVLQKQVGERKEATISFVRSLGILLAQKNKGKKDSETLNGIFLNPNQP